MASTPARPNPLLFPRGYYSACTLQDLLNVGGRGGSAPSTHLRIKILWFFLRSVMLLCTESFCPADSCTRLRTQAKSHTRQCWKLSLAKRRSQQLTRNPRTRESREHRTLAAKATISGPQLRCTRRTRLPPHPSLLPLPMAILPILRLQDIDPGSGSDVPMHNSGIRAGT